MGNFLSAEAKAVPNFSGPPVNMKALAQALQLFEEGLCLTEHGDLEAATANLTQALPVFEHILGPCAPFTIRIKSRLAALLAPPEHPDESLWRQTYSTCLYPIPATSLLLDITQSNHEDVEDSYSADLSISEVTQQSTVVGRALECTRRSWEREREPSLKNSSSSKNDLTIFNRDIKIMGAGGNWVHAMALLDTQCQIGNWISRRLVERLGKLQSIAPAYDPPEIVEACGQPVRACGVISLEWGWHPRRCRIHECQFYILPTSSHLDVLFGVEYIVSENLLLVNESALVPLVEHKNLKKGDKAAVAIAKERQRQEKAALEERRRQATQKGATQGDSVQKGKQQVN